MRGRGPGRMGAAGLTLVELVVVLAVLAAIVGLALPSVRRGSEGLRLRAEAGRVAAALREARHRAVSQRRPTRILLAEDRHALLLGWAGDEEAGALRRVELAQAVRLEALAGGRALTFSPRGHTRDARWAVEGPGGRRLLIDVHGVTGRVTVAVPGAS